MPVLFLGLGGVSLEPSEGAPAPASHIEVDPLFECDATQPAHSYAFPGRQVEDQDVGVPGPVLTHSGVVTGH